MSSRELQPIIFYDIPSNRPGHPWSPNTMKTRYCLGYKRLPFTTVWVELPDIAGLFQSKAITQPPYTLPAIEDPNTGAFIVDSFAIAAYLDETYPETPTVLSPAARMVLQGIDDVFSFGSTRLGMGNANSASNGDKGVRTTTDAVKTSSDSLVPRLVFLILASERLNPVSKAYYHETRGTRIGTPWTSLVYACSAGTEQRAGCVRQGIEAIRDVWRKITTRVYGGRAEGETRSVDLDTSGIDQTFALGEEPCFIDFAVGGRVWFVMESLTSTETAVLKKIDHGRLVKLVEDLERYL